MTQQMHKQRMSVLLLVSSVFMASVAQMFLSGGFMSFMLSYNLCQISTVEFSASFIFDNLSVSFSALVLGVSGCVFMFSRWYMKDDPYFWRFSWLLLLFVISMNLLIFSGSVLVLMLGWDGLGITSFLLIIYYQSGSSLGAGFLTLLINRLGDVLIMGSVIYFLAMGSFFLILNTSLPPMFFAVIMVAAITKSAQYPFSPWLPAAMAAPTPVSALVHSSTLVTAGIYLLIRFSESCKFNSSVLGVLLLLGCVTSFVGGVCAFFENDLKKVIAYSTLSQLGLMVFSLGLGATSLALFHLYMHALFKALLFLAGGYILMQSFGVQDLRLLGGTLQRQPLGLIFLNISSLCLMGFPFLSAYYSKHAILGCLFTSKVNIFPFIILMISLVFSSAYMVRLLMLLNWQSSSGAPLKAMAFQSNFPYWVPMMLLYLGSVFLGSFLKVMNQALIDFNFYSPKLDILLYILMVFGVFLGASKKGKGSLFVYNMFYMVPFWQGLPSLSYTFNKGAKELEGYWFEPYSYLYNWNGSNVNQFGLLNWQKISFGYMQQYFILLFIVFILWLL